MYKQCNSENTAKRQRHLENCLLELMQISPYPQIAVGDIQYDRIVFFEKDLDGRITALKTNMSEVNRLKTDILNIINDEILALDHSDIGIPLGSLFFPELLSGKGPAIPVRILSIRNSDANFVSHFSQAGINQTLHRLNMEVSIDVAVLVLGHTSSFTMVSEVVVAETVIVGAVPNTYLYTGGTYESERKNPGLLHAKLGAYIAKTKYDIKDQEIVDAIAYHTTGRPAMTLLDKIVYIADYLEPNRNMAPNLTEVRKLAFEDINECLYLILKDSLAYLETKSEVIDPMTEQTYYYYKKELNK